MILKSKVILDPRKAKEFFEELLSRRPGYLPEWLPFERGSDVALLQILARHLQTITQRLNQAPDKNKLAFLDLLGINLIPAQAARAPVVFKLTEQASDTRVAEGTLLMAKPPPESQEQIFFEVETSTSIAAAQLKEVVSLWPGRDQYIDHSEDFLAEESFQLFQKSELEYTPHEIYIAHDTLLALAGKTMLDVEFELAQPSSESLNIIWEYWDGQVWRSFKSMNQSCSEDEMEKLDGTNGFTNSGIFRLETDCAETEKTIVDDAEAYWIRGKLTDPLLPDAGNLLPAVGDIKLTCEIIHPLVIGWVVTASTSTTQLYHSTGRTVIVTAQTEDGVPLTSADVEIAGENEYGKTNVEGTYIFENLNDTVEKTVTVSMDGVQDSANVALEYSDHAAMVMFTAKLSELKFDKAFANETEIDLSKSFYPFDLQPIPGSAFYFTSEEIFSKPGAQVQLYAVRAKTPQDELGITGPTGSPPPTTTKLDHMVAWEYWNGRRWALMFQSTNSTSPSRDLNETEIIEFTVPFDMVKSEVNGEEALWMRARLVSGGFGYKNSITWNSTNSDTFSFVIYQPPMLSDICLGYKWQNGPYYPEKVLTYNDFQYEDHTDEAIWPGKTFLPFRTIGDVTPTLYLGFDKQLPVDRISLYLDIVEEVGETEGPGLIWEYWDGSAWLQISVEDETNYLRIPGMISFIASQDSESLARFGTDLHWLRGRLKEDQQPGEPVFRMIYPNATWVAQRQTFTNETLGISSGQSDQIFHFRQSPILEGERIEVLELSGSRARVEWRILAEEVSGGDENFVRELEEMLGQEGLETNITKGELRLKRNAEKQVTEVWVCWQEKAHLFFSGSDDRHYMLDRTLGRLFFGMRYGPEDTIRGKIPPAGATILARKYQAGGGSAGNVAENAISQLLGSVSGVEAVSNPKVAEGGADREINEALLVRGPRTVRHRGRAISVHDYEALAHEASSAVAVAQAIPTFNSEGIEIPGHITLIIIPKSKEPQPQPSFGLRDKVRKYIEACAPADIVSSKNIHIAGPKYQPVDVTATIAPEDPAEAGAVEQDVREALEDFLNPLRGGPEKRGWESGRSVYLSDVASVLERVEGVDYVEELALMLEGVLQDEKAGIPVGCIVAAGDIKIKLKSSE